MIILRKRLRRNDDRAVTTLCAVSIKWHYICCMVVNRSVRALTRQSLGSSGMSFCYYSSLLVRSLSHFLPFVFSPFVCCIFHFSRLFCFHYKVLYKSRNFVFIVRLFNFLAAELFFLILAHLYIKCE
jgi:hypothetical protein